MQSVQIQRRAAGLLFVLPNSTMGIPEMNINIAPFTMDVYEKVMALWNEAEGVGLSGADSKENIRSYLDRNPTMSLIAEDSQGTLLGAVLCGHDGRRGYIYHLAVHSDHRRRGIGRKLVQECLARLKVAGIQKCHIFIFEDNAGGTVGKP
jgi:ribosomal protein S18 acetylase RimI-like enzyme